MRRNALRKDFWMEIRRSFPRFISIFLIVGLGVAFFSGIRAARPDMELSADRLYDERNFMDIQVLGTLGLNEGDLSALRGVEGIEDAEGAYSKDVLFHTEQKQFVVKMMSMPERINQISLKEGRLPEKAEECLADLAFLEDTGLRIGDTVAVESGDGDDLGEFLAQESFTITGSCSSPQYLSMSRGNSSIGSGSLDSFLIVPPEAFSMDYYTEIYLTVENAKELLCYGGAYTDRVEAVTDRIQDEVVPVREQSRYEQIHREADEKLSNAEKEVEDGEKEAGEKLDDARREIEDGEKELENGKEEIEENRRKLSDAGEEIAEGERELSDAEEEIEKNEEKLNKAARELEQGNREYQKGKKIYEEKRLEYEGGVKSLKEAKKQLDETKKQLSEARKGLKEAREAIRTQEDAGLISPEMAAQMQETLSAQETELSEGESQLAAGQKEYKENAAVLSAAEKELKAARTELDEAKAELDAGQKEYDDGRKALLAARRQLDGEKERLADAKAELADGKKELQKAEKELKASEKELADGKADYKEAKEKAEKELSDARAELADAREELDRVKPAEWYVLDRNSIQTYMEFAQDAERIGAIGELFPLIFFLVAALVCLTTMTRMVEEERTEIGTLKALGYGKASIAMKYIGYAFLAMAGGSIAGGLLGCKVLPYVIITAYKTMYQNLDIVLTPFNWPYILYASLLAAACVLAATAAACFKELTASPAQLMRPAAPGKGKRVLLERVGILWRHLNFTGKATVRNLFRYKKRFFMTIFGIAGCMALLLVGFGVKDSIFSIVSLQFQEVEIYDAAFDIDDSDPEENLMTLENRLDENADIKGYKRLNYSLEEASHGDKNMDVYQKVFDNAEGLENYISFRSRRTKKQYYLSDKGVLVTEKLAKKLGIKDGDELTLKNKDREPVTVLVEAVVENYVYNYVYMTAALYERLYQEPVVYNQIILNEALPENKSEEEFANELLAMDEVTGITLTDSMEAWFSDIIGSLDIVVLVLIVSAGGLAFVVLYNLNNISINERQRELATLKVLGFYDLEVSEYMYRENIILTLLGMVFGIFLGLLLHRYVIITCEIDMIMFGRNIFPVSYVYSAALTCLFAFLINLSMHFKLKRIDMASSLKSVE